MDTKLITFSILTIIVLISLTVYFLTSYLAHSALREKALDLPTYRSLHQRPTPRTGGLAVLTGILIGEMLFIFLGNFSVIILVLGVIILAFISFLDDLYNLSAQWRILVHFSVSFILILGDYLPNSLQFPGCILAFPIWISILGSMLFSVWMINLYNFMDGMDGFAGGMAVIGFVTLACLGHADHAFMSFCLVVAAASAGFLVHNFPPAKIFMGDVGSTMLGFLAAACILWGSKLGLFPFWVGILVFSPFIVDATVTLLKRLLRGERVWEAHRTHYYQRLVLLGWGHRRTVLVEYVLMLACAGSALLAVRLSPSGQIILIVTWALIYPLLMFGVGWLERRRATVSSL